MTKSKRIIVVAEGDSHGGNKLGLLSPDTKLPTEEINGIDELKISWESPQLTKTQEAIWNVRQPAIESIKEIAKDDPIVVLELGDLTQGDKYSNELVTTRVGDQQLIAYYNLLEWYKLKSLHSVIYAKGTGSHNLGFGSTEINICHMFKNMYPGVRSDIAYHWLLDIGGITFDIAHHGAGSGIRHWLRGNVARYYLRDIIYTEVFAGRTPPDVVLRAHFHTYVKEFLSTTFQGNEYDSWLYVIPPLCVPGDYAIKVIKSVYSIGVGLLAFEVVDGQIRETYKFTQNFDARVKEKIL